MLRVVGVVLSALAVLGCQVSPSETADLERLPSCFARDVPQPRPGRGKVRLRWVLQPDGAFRPQRIDISFDGVRMYESQSAEALQKELLLLADVDVSPGPHRLDSLVEVSGVGSGVFAYLNGYRFETNNQRTFSVEPGEVQCISVVLHYRGNLTTPLNERPATLFAEESAPGR
jgi:hypothetical protein